MAFSSRSSGQTASLDEFIGEGRERTPSNFEIADAATHWQERIARTGHRGDRASSATDSAIARELALSAFSLIRGGDRFDAPKHKNARPHTEQELLAIYANENVHVSQNRVRGEIVDAALDGVLGVLRGNPALAKRMRLQKAIRLELVPSRRDFREFGFPPHTNPSAAGIFWNREEEPVALLGLREEYVLEKPWLAVHEMAHAVHLTSLTTRERADLEAFLLPVYRSRRGVEEAFAIYAERAFGARYAEEDLAAPGFYGKIRREWNAEHLFAQFVRELFRPA